MKREFWIPSGTGKCPPQPYCGYDVDGSDYGCDCISGCDKCREFDDCDDCDCMNVSPYRYPFNGSIMIPGRPFRARHIVKMVVMVNYLKSELTFVLHNSVPGSERSLRRGREEAVALTGTLIRTWNVNTAALSLHHMAFYKLFTCYTVMMLRYLHGVQALAVKSFGLYRTSREVSWNGRLLVSQTI